MSKRSGGAEKEASTEATSGATEGKEGVDHIRYIVRGRESCEGLGEAGDEVKVLSWYVNGLSRAKMESENFVNTIAENDIVFSYE